MQKIKLHHLLQDIKTGFNVCKTALHKPVSSDMRIYGPLSRLNKVARVIEGKRISCGMTELFTRVLSEKVPQVLKYREIAMCIHQGGNLTATHQGIS